MNAEIFAEWLRLQGHHVVRTASTWWLDQGPKCYQAFPYHWLISPSEQELKQFFVDHRAFTLRYSTPLDAPLGRMSYHMVCGDPDYDVESLGKWARKNVRRGLRSCSVGPISFDRLADEGWSLQQDTLERQGRSAGISHDGWRNLCRSAASLPGFDAWAATVSGQLAASVITFQLDDCCYMLYQQCRKEFLAAHVNNALSFTVTQTMLRRERIRSIFYCLHSLDAPPTMDEFKLRMGYTPKPVRQRVVFHPWCAPLVNPLTRQALKSLVALRPASLALRKGEGMVRFYLEGKRPLEEQSIPDALALAQQEHEANSGSPSCDSRFDSAVTRDAADRFVGESGFARSRAVPE